MNTHQIERAAYIAAHAVIVADTAAPELACPGARRSHAVDTIAAIIKNIFELHASEFDAYTDWSSEDPARRRTDSLLAVESARSEKILPIRAEISAQIGR